MDKIKNILALLFTGRDDCPDAFAPAHSGLAAGSLCNPSINHHGANLTFGAIIGRLDIRVGQESEVAVRRIAFESLGQLFGQRMIRRRLGYTTRVFPSVAEEKVWTAPFHRCIPTMCGRMILWKIPA